MVQTTTLHNPVLRGMYPDPSWMWDDSRDESILVNSSFELIPGLPIHASRDFAHWTHVSYAMNSEMAQALLIPYVLDSGGLYAPTIRKIAGKYVIACTVARLDESAARADGISETVLEKYRASEGNFIITAQSLEGPWEGPFWIEGAQGIDPDIFEDRDGSVYWTQTRPALVPQWEGQTEVWTQRIDPSDWTLVESSDEFGTYSKTVLWNGYGVNAVWAEGPHLYRIGEFVYLMTAEGGTSFDHSAMMMRTQSSEGFGKSISQFMHDVLSVDLAALPISGNERSVVGQYHRLFVADKKNPFLTHRHLGLAEQVQCVGHADLLQHPKSGWWATCLGVRETVGPNPGELLSYLGRETFVFPLEWQHDPANWQLEGHAKQTASTACDPGWPVVRLGLGRLPKSLDIGLDDQGNAVNVALHKCSCESGCENEHTYAVSSEVELVNRDDIRLATVRNPESTPFLRVDADDYAAIVPLGSTLVLHQDSVNAVKIRGSRIGDKDVLIHVEVTCAGITEDVEQLCSSGPEFVGIWLHNNTVDCFGLHSDGVEGANFTENTLFAHITGNVDQRHVVHSLDGRFMSTEWAGGFVGCMMGVEA